MKQFLGQQKADFRATKAIYKKQLEDDTGLSGPQRKQILEERKRELTSQQKGNEQEHLQILQTIAEQNRVEFRQQMMKDRQSFEKGLLQQVKGFIVKCSNFNHPYIHILYCMYDIVFVHMCMYVASANTI